MLLWRYTKYGVHCTVDLISFRKFTPKEAKVKIPKEHIEKKNAKKLVYLFYGMSK